jgi:hypothetical protein
LAGLYATRYVESPSLISREETYKPVSVEPRMLHIALMVTVGRRMIRR